MLSVLHAEWRKVTGNYLILSATVWVFPVAAFVFLLVVSLLFLASGESPGVGDGGWQQAGLGVWLLFTEFPMNVSVQLFVTAYMAVFFAGEYEWNTWKHIVPRTRRGSLIVSKFLVLTALLLLSLALTSLIWTLGAWVLHAIAGYAYGPALTLDALADFLPRYALEVGLSAASALVLAGFAALAVLLTRSVVGGLLLGFGFSVIELVSGLLLSLIGTLLSAPRLADLYAFTPSFSIANIRSWVVADAAAPLVETAPTLVGSVAVLLTWVIGLMLLTTAIFERQDLA